MKNLKWFPAALLAVLCAAGPVLAQEAKKAPPKPAPDLTGGVLDQWNDIGRKLVAMAEDFPEDKWGYKPAPESRTFKANLAHASGSMYYFTDTAEGKKPRYPDAYAGDDLKTRADLVAFVKKCVADGAEAIKKKGDQGLQESVDIGDTHLYKLYDLAYGLVEHSGEHYGQLVTYYRANGLVPPESRPKK
ncbi:MAG: DinB family protein [Deltaproteobacteria bacterium]|nr:DinB family protein [Deltaproteobacteria bacterium]